MHDTIRFGSVRGIPIGVHWSVLVVAGIVVWGLGGGGLAALHPGHGAVEYWIAATVATLAFFASLVLHELGHALVAIRHGTRVQGITLWFLGGVARLAADNPTPGVEWRVGIAGPAVSLTSGALALAAAAGLEAIDPSTVAAVALAWLGVMNLVLGLFNLLPAYPLDGGRVLRAMLWARHGDRVRASEQAAAAGTVVAWLLAGAGIAAVAVGLWVSGLWLVLVAVFVRAAGRAEAAAVRDDEARRTGGRGPVGPGPLAGADLRAALAGDRPTGQAAA